MALSYEEKRLKFIRICGLAFFIIGIILLFIFLFMNENLLSNNTYKFQTSASPQETKLDKFQIYYDFVNDVGNISFTLYRTNYTDRLEFDIPSILTAYDVVWETDRTSIQYKDGKDFNKYERSIDNLPSGYPATKNIVIENMDMNKKEYASIFTLKLKGKLSPNAQFGFDNGGLAISVRGGNENGAFFKFYLGNKFECQDKCYESFRENEIDFGYNDNTLRASTLRKKEGGWDSVGNYVFYLNYNKKVSDFKINLFNVSLLLISLGVIPTIELIYLANLKNKRKRSHH